MNPLAVTVPLHDGAITLSLIEDAWKRRQWRDAAERFLCASRDGRLTDIRWLIAGIQHGTEGKVPPLDCLREREVEAVLEAMCTACADADKRIGELN